MPYAPSIEGQEHIVDHVLPPGSEDRAEIEEELCELAALPVGNLPIPISGSVMAEIDESQLSKYSQEAVIYSIQHWASRLIEVEPCAIEVTVSAIQATRLSSEVNLYLKIEYNPPST